MKIIKAIAVDDEPLALRVIESHADKIQFLSLEYTTTKALDAINYIRENKVDLIFLYVQMPDLTGFQFMNLIDKKPKIILTTAYQDYAYSSYDYEVLDYLLKPISLERLIKASQKALKQIYAEHNVNTSTNPSEQDPFSSEKINLHIPPDS